ncbi:MAG: ankyrin repeat domain-containing protein [Phycisphaerales bacterium]|nr:ankyrin repeat domain-containing protein [Phycisphaerales bacterium]
MVAAGTDVDTLFDISLDPGAYQRWASPLMVAAGSGDGASIETVRLLLDLGADPGLVVAKDTAVSFASMGLGWNYRPGGDAARLGLLLKHGAALPPDPEWANRCLCDAARAGDEDRVGLLLGVGLSADGLPDPETREHHPGDWQVTATAKPSTPAPAEPDMLVGPREEEWRPLAFEEVVPEVAEVAASSAGPMIVCGYFWPFARPLMCAAMSGNARLVRLLLERGADPLRRDSEGRTAMYDATTAEVVGVLREAGVPLEDVDMYGRTPLISALVDPEEDDARALALLAGGADPNGSYDRGYTTFMSAVSSGWGVSMLRCLVDAGADPCAVSELGWNAFHGAADRSTGLRHATTVREVFRYLLDLGVDINQRNTQGCTPRDLASMWGNEPQLTVLSELGATS